jgi:hypothetical protein
MKMIVYQGRGPGGIRGLKEIIFTKRGNKTSINAKKMCPPKNNFTTST